jgi:hypothetical protein
MGHVHSCAVYADGECKIHKKEKAVGEEEEPGNIIFVYNNSHSADDAHMRMRCA